MSTVSNASLGRVPRSLVFVALLGVATTIIYPFLFLVVTALRSNEDYLRNSFGWPDRVSLDNFVTLNEVYGVGRSFLNSLLVVSVSLVLTLVLAVLAGYALATLPVPGAKYITAAFVSVMLIPGQVLVIPLYLLLAKFGLVGNYGGLVVIYTVTGLPFSVFFLTLSFRTLSAEIIEAATIDGAGFFRTLWSVALPMGVSGVATVAVLQFLGMWNELLFAYILIQDQEQMLLTPALARIGGKFVTDQTLVSAGLLVTASMPLLLLAVASRYIMRGLSTGLKG